MIFQKVEIKNFLSVGEAVVPLADRGLTLIEGVNLDDPSAKSNGAGKSSLVDAICWVLYGKTARGLSGDDVTNRSSKKGAVVSLYVQNETDNYVITRSRKPAKLEVKLLNGTAVTTLTKGTTAETQKAIEDLIGCSYNVFIAAVYAGQEIMPDLPNMTDKQLKELIESVIGVERLQKAYTKALEESHEAGKQVDILEVRCDMFASQLTSDEARRHEAEKNFNEYYSKILHEVDAMDLSIQTRRDEHAASVLALDGRKKDVEEAQKRIKEIDAHVAEFDKFNEEVEKLRKEQRNAERAVESANFELNRLKSEAQRHLVDLKNISSRVGTACSECGKTYQAEDLADAENAKKKLAKEAIDKAQVAKDAMIPLEKDLEDAKMKLKEAIAKLPNFGALNEERCSLANVVSKFNDEFCQIENEKVLIDELEANLEATRAKLSADNPYSAILAQAKDELETTKSELEHTFVQLELQKKRYEVACGVRDVFGQHGVRQHVLETITPVLNDRTARYLDVLSDGKLSAVWTTLTTTKKGEAKEKFNIEVSNSVGGKGFESLSGGEKRKVRVACCLALQEIVASRATKPIELFIADEVDHALDEAGVERLIGLLEEKAKVCKSLFVISHNPLRNWIDNTITVIKEDGISRIE